MSASIFRFFAISTASLVFSAAAAEAPPSSPTPSAPSSAGDRTANLQKFFARYHCAKPYPILDYLRIADHYQLDYRVLPAISIRETGCGKSGGPLNNLWGFHQQSFPSLAAGIEFLAHRLTQHKLYREKTLDQKLFTYNPRSAYPGEVVRIMRQIDDAMR